MIIFDLTNKDSLEYLNNWERDNKEYVRADTTAMLIGTKADLIEQRELPWEYLKMQTDRYNMIYFETSGKTGQGIKELLRIIAETALNKNKKPTIW